MTLMDNVLYGLDKDGMDEETGEKCYSEDRAAAVTEALSLAGLPVTGEDNQLGLRLSTRVGEVSGIPDSAPLPPRRFLLSLARSPGRQNALRRSEAEGGDSQGPGPNVRRVRGYRTTLALPVLSPLPESSLLLDEPTYVTLSLL